MSDAHAPAHAAPDAKVPPPATPPPPTPPQRRGVWPLLFGAGAAFIILVLAAIFLIPAFWEESTDDAYVEAHVVSIVAKVPAYVIALHVDDNSAVRAGAAMLDLDPRDYINAAALAHADLAAATGKLTQAQVQVRVADAAVRQSEAELQVAQANDKLAADNLRRVLSVSDIRAVSSERVDEQRTQAASARATLAANDVRVASARAQSDLARAEVTTANAAVAQAQARLDEALLDLSYTHIVAPEDGTVANKSVQLGNYVEPGQLLLSLVPPRRFVVANYRDPGQRVSITIDAFPGRTFRGHVDSLQPGTGARFALLPPQNATGNFVKIAQRVPVKIVFDGDDPALNGIVPGLSCETKVFTGERPSWLGFLP
jgi:membrane fusion protein (multidrug efflux system)